MKPDRTQDPRRGDSRRAASSTRYSSHRRRRRWKWILLGVFVGLLAVGALSAKPAWRAFKAFRAQRFVAESNQFIEAEEWSRAFDRARSALQLAPYDPRVLRHAAELYGRFHSEIALGYYEQLLTSRSATRQDREGYAALALALGDTGLAGTILEDLLATNPSPRTLLLGAQYHTLRQNQPEALRLARLAIKADPKNPTNAVALASLLSASRDSADRAEAINVLWPHARAEGPSQVRALAAILMAPQATREDREEVEAILRAKPTRTMEEDLLWLEAQVSLDPSQRNRIAEQVIERYGRGTREQMAATAAWLNRQQLYQQTLALLLPDIALEEEALARLRYDALVGVGDLRGAYDFLTNDKLKADPIKIEFQRCAAAVQLDDDVAVEMHLRNLLDLARRHPRHLRAVAEYARRNGKLEIANEANQMLINNPREAIPAFQSLLRTADLQGETWVARDYARKLYSLKKDDGIRLQIAYYDLLLEENIEEAFATARELYEANPADFNRRAVLALAYLRQDEPDKAVSLVEGQVVTWRRLAPGVRAVVIAALGASGRRATVARLLDRVPIATLKPEERELIRPHVAGLASSRTAESSSDDPEKL